MIKSRLQSRERADKIASQIASSVGERSLYVKSTSVVESKLDQPFQEPYANALTYDFMPKPKVLLPVTKVS